MAFDDLVKGTIAVQNRELDDLVILRADGVPTYNFGVVVDDLDMNITHVIRGDDHVNNTPRQVNILRALGATLPHYGHVPMILGHDGERLSKRHGAVSVLQYRDDGYLPEALLNYLARLGWSHGDDEMFSVEQFVEWFDLAAVHRAPARFDPEKLRWTQPAASEVRRRRPARGARTAVPCRGWLRRRGRPGSRQRHRAGEGAGRHGRGAGRCDGVLLSARRAESRRCAISTTRPSRLQAVSALRLSLDSIDWNRQAIGQAIKQAAADHGLKMPKVAMPLRVMVTGETQTPSIDAVIELIGRERVLERLDRELATFRR